MLMLGCRQVRQGGVCVHVPSSLLPQLRGVCTCTLLPPASVLWCVCTCTLLSSASVVWCVCTCSLLPPASVVWCVCICPLLRPASVAWCVYMYPPPSCGCLSCVVCMSDFQSREIRSFRLCGHDFHQKCIDKWLHVSGL